MRHRKSVSLDQPRDEEFLQTVFEQLPVKTSFQQTSCHIIQNVCAKIYTILRDFCTQKDTREQGCKSSCQDQSCQICQHKKYKIWDAYKNEKHPFGYT